MSEPHAHFLSALLPAAALLASGLALVPAQTRAQQAQSRLTPLIVHPGAEPIGSSLRLTHERVDLSTITREDTSMMIGRDLAQGESVTTIRKQPPPAPDPGRERRQHVIREEDELRHKRITVIYDD